MESKKNTFAGKPLMSRATATAVDKKEVEVKKYSELEQTLITYGLFDTVEGMKEVKKD